MSDYAKPKGLSSALSYADPNSAFRWLETAFGFEPVMAILDRNEKIVHSEMKYGESIVVIGGEWSGDHRSPKSIGGKNTQSVHVQLARGEDIGPHCDRARKAGAKILQEPEMQFYGDCTYRARDLEGHVWTFSVTVHEMTPEEWDRAAGGGLHTRTRL